MRASGYTNILSVSFPESNLDFPLIHLAYFYRTLCNEDLLWNDKIIYDQRISNLDFLLRDAMSFREAVKLIREKIPNTLGHIVCVIVFTENLDLLRALEKDKNFSVYIASGIAGAEPLITELKFKILDYKLRKLAYGLEENVFIIVLGISEELYNIYTNQIDEYIELNNSDKISKYIQKYFQPLYILEDFPFQEYHYQRKTYHSYNQSIYQNIIKLQNQINFLLFKYNNKYYLTNIDKYINSNIPDKTYKAIIQTEMSYIPEKIDVQDYTFIRDFRYTFLFDYARKDFDRISVFNTSISKYNGLYNLIQIESPMQLFGFNPGDIGFISNMFEWKIYLILNLSTFSIYTVGKDMKQSVKTVYNALIINETDLKK